MLKNYTLKNKILTLVVFVFTLVSLGTYFYLSDFLEKSFMKKIDNDLSEKTEQFYDYVKDSGRRAALMASIFSEASFVKDAYKVALEGDISSEDSKSAQKAREMLRESIRGFSKGHDLVNRPGFQIHYHLPNTRSLLRAWSEKQIKRNGKWLDVSDDLSSFRQIIIDVKNSKEKYLSGIEVGRGGFAVRGITKIQSDNGDYIGSVEYLESFEDILSLIKKSDKQVLVSLMNSNLLELANALQDESKNPKRGSFIQVSSTNNDLFNFLDVKVLEKGKNERFIFSAGKYRLSIFPINDYAGRNIGLAIYGLDISSEIAEISSLKLYIALSALIIIVLISILLFYVFSSSLRPLDKAISKISDIASNLNDSSDSLAEGSITLSDISQNQAASVEETSASIEEITGMAKKNSENAKDAFEEAEKVTAKARDAEASTNELLENLKGIEASNEKIQKLVSIIERIGEKTDIIDEIAFQTKLLSFNASVESERAGEAGRGFSVVAQEVANLAKVSCKSAQDITEILKESLAEAKAITAENSAKVLSVKKGLDKSVEHVKSIIEASSEVLNASKVIMDGSYEQLQGVQQINKAISQLDQSIQKTSAIASDSTETGNQVKQKASDLNENTDVLVKIIKGHK